MPVAGNRTYTITSLQRGLRLLALFAKEERGLSASDVARLTSLPVSTVHRFLVNLKSAAFLSCDPSGVYHLGTACVSLGQAARAQLDVRTASMPHLQELNLRTRETVHLTVRHGLSAVYVEKLDSPEPLRIHSRVGATIPLYCTAVGKILLAYLSDSEREKVLEQLELKRFTESTASNLQELNAELRRTRKNGFACDLEEHELHVRCIAAPIWDHSGAVNASLSVTGPAVRMSTTRLRQLAPLIREAGLSISAQLGYQPAIKTRATRSSPIAVKSAPRQAHTRTGVISSDTGAARNR